MNAEELHAYLVAEFPQAFGEDRPHRVVRVDGAGVGLTLSASEEHLRPGDTVSGPSMMGLADIAAYAVILAAIGPVPLAVTTSFSINFLRKPPAGLLVADARLMKLGKRLAVCEVGLRAPHEGGNPFAVTGEEELCAHAVTTYSIPS
ncbi:PaaI family thioesterase [Ancylobacter pratisalsi]|uniref:PaaI family thioesterase n=1 Tax=Ancylobacter pratisalsi TaxID=1745854 RepID=A0A6P1YRV8_9HYPH|nr:PaaI family thioesterase [Ancylobacter pratisalsi]QIB35446.1 PaaI family thioesterase [Ancylobacter pratisalsi]